MFSVIKKKKAAHWFTDNSLCWQDSIKIEDTMTALVFDTLLGVTGESVASLLTSITHHTYCDFDWLKDDTYESIPWINLGACEPDWLLIDYRNKKALIVEAKQDNAYQSYHQLLKELQTVELAYPNYEISLLVFGGNSILSSCAELVANSPTEISVCSSSWNQFVHAVKKVKEQSSDKRDRRVLKYLLDALEWFGFTAFLGFSFRLAGTEFTKQLNQLPFFVPEEARCVKKNQNDLHGFENIFYKDFSKGHKLIDTWKII